jgi:polar amino acid transport system substrate-binding protein
MRTTDCLATATLALLLAGCAGWNAPTQEARQASAAPTQEVRQALAPTGKLRIGLQRGNPLNLVQAAGSSEAKGVGLELGTELARRIGMPFEIVLYPSIGALLEGGKAGAWDFAHVGFTAERAKEFDFAPPHIEVEFGYLVPAGSSISAIADVDRPGIRVAVQEKSGPEAFFMRTLKSAALVRGPSNPGALEVLKSGKADVMGSIKPILSDLSGQFPGSRILDGRPGVDPHAVAIPKGRDAGAAYVRRFMQEAKASGLVKGAVDRAGLRGVVVAP